jgi:hypothetical protein
MMPRDLIFALEILCPAKRVVLLVVELIAAPYACAELGT